MNYTVAVDVFAFAKERKAIREYRFDTWHDSLLPPNERRSFLFCLGTWSNAKRDLPDFPLRPWNRKIQIDRKSFSALDEKAFPKTCIFLITFNWLYQIYAVRSHHYNYSFYRVHACLDFHQYSTNCDSLFNPCTANRTSIYKFPRNIAKLLHTFLRRS